MKVVGKTMDAGATITAHAMRETVSLSFASVLKISYVFITRDEHTFFLCKRLSFRCHTRKYSTFSEDSKFLLYLIAVFSDIRAFRHLHPRLWFFILSGGQSGINSRAQCSLQVVETVDFVVEGVLRLGYAVKEDLLLPEHGGVCRGGG